MDLAPRAQYAASLSGPPIYLLRLDSWCEAFPRHWHEEWGIAVILQGVNRFWFRGAWYNAGPGSIIVVPPGEVHDGGLCADSPWGERMCYVPVESMARLVEAHTGRGGTPHFAKPIVEDKALASSLLHLHQVLTGDGGSDPLHSSEIKIACIGELAARHGKARGRNTQPAPSAAIDEVIELFHDEPQLHVTIEELAARVGLSPFHLIRTFNRRVGLTPHAYLKQLRVIRAQEMLRAGVPIAKAAVACGFADQPHLTREFRRTLGVTPGKYRRCGSLSVTCAVDGP